METAFVALLTGFAVGSIPFGFLLVRLLGRGDIRSVGSGNIGATNVGRLLGPVGWTTTLAADAGKGAVSALLGGMLASGGSVPAVAGAVGAVLGHCFTPWLRGRGGKGVATMFGAFGVLTPWASLVALLSFGLVAGWFRTVSLASLSAAVLLALGSWAMRDSADVIAGTAVVALVVVWRHRDNIVRLRSGSESRLGGKRL